MKVHFSKLNIPGIRVVSSDTPLATSDAWVTIRTPEAKLSPDLSRTVACVHDLYEHDDMYAPHGHRAVVRKVRGLILCHPSQRTILESAGVDLSATEILERPLGALASFSPASVPPPKFTIGWVGRNYWRKRIELFIEAIQELGLPKDQFRIMIMGKEIEEPVEELQKLGFECKGYHKTEYPIETYPELYRQMDCLVVTGVTEAGPLTFFESLATGNPVVSTRVGWAPILQPENPDAIRLVDNPTEIAAALREINSTREELFAKRFEIAKVVDKWTLEGWFADVVKFAAALAPQRVMEQV
jgi:glycosyltransferase involved in cell wall biosynthesis